MSNNQDPYEAARREIEFFDRWRDNLCGRIPDAELTARELLRVAPIVKAAEAQEKARYALADYKAACVSALDRDETEMALLVEDHRKAYRATEAAVRAGGKP